MLDHQTALTGYVTVHTENNGSTSEERLDSLTQSLTPSANALRKALAKLGESSPEEAVPTTKAEGGEKEVNRDKTRSTETYHFEIQADKAIAALNKVDSTGNSDAFDRRFAIYQQTLQSVLGGASSLKDLPLETRVEALKKLNSCSFTSYSFQVSIRVPESLADDKYIRSKKHHQMQGLSEESLKDLLKPYTSKWIGKISSTVNKGKEPDDPPAALQPESTNG